jgi:hypothetical protein
MKPSTLESLCEQIQIWQEIKAEDASLAFAADDILNGLEKKHSILRVLTACLDTTGAGMTLRNRFAQSWGIILPDATESGQWRWQGFRADGFFGHATFATPELALGDLVDLGYTEIDKGALDRLSVQPVWSRGMEVTALIQACNSGLIDWEEANRRHAELNARYSACA